MAQRDAKVNIALAENSAMIARASKEDSAVMRTIAIESKRDSSAMKTIAILGMLFLPGTFIAVSFQSLSLIDYRRQSLTSIDRLSLRCQSLSTIRMALQPLRLDLNIIGQSLSL